MRSIETLLFVLTVVAAVGSGLIGGVFFAFSSFVMRVLQRMPTGSGMAAMQEINLAVMTPSFLGVFLGTTTACVLLVVIAVWRWPVSAAESLILGGSSYLGGTFLVTVMFNVPRNEALARIDPLGPDAEVAWRRYLFEWTRWNHVRTLAAVAACVYLAIALAQLPPAAK